MEIKEINNKSFSDIFLLTIAMLITVVVFSLFYGLPLCASIGLLGLVVLSTFFTSWFLEIVFLWNRSVGEIKKIRLFVLVTLGLIILALFVLLVLSLLLGFFALIETYIDTSHMLSLIVSMFGGYLGSEWFNLSNNCEYVRKKSEAVVQNISKKMKNA